MINRLQRPKPHADGWELPEIRHEPGVGIRRKPAALMEFAAEILQLLFREPPFQERPRIHAWRSVPLEVNDIAVSAFRPGMQKMIECNFIESRGRGEG